MLILIVEGLTCICTINDILIQISLLKKTHECLVAANIIFILNVKFFTSSPSCIPVSLLLSHHSQIKVLDGEDEYYKLLSTVESIPEEEYATTPPSHPF